METTPTQEPDEARYRALMADARRGQLGPAGVREVPQLVTRLGALRCAQIDYEMEQDAIKEMNA